jgi:LemA protein
VSIIFVAGVVLAVCLLAVAVLGVATFNRLVRLRNQVEAAWAQIDVQLKRRHSLIPNLVETVQGYVAHERGTLESLTAARTAAMHAADPSALAAAEGDLTQALGRLFAVAEGYPDLKANTTFLSLQAELATTEDKIAYARQFYNTAVQSLNATVQSFPTSVVASLTAFTERGYFEAAADDRDDVQVRF